MKIVPGENKLYSMDDVDDVRFALEQDKWICIVLAHRNERPRVEITLSSLTFCPISS